jgi:hypothetical protein
LTHYSILVSLHVASVVVWLGVGTTVALLTVYAGRARDDAILARIGAFVGWLGPRVLAPSALSALGFGIAAAHSGHWPRIFFFHVGEAAFAASFLITVLLRVPLLRRARRGVLEPARLARLLLSLAVSELTVLFLAVVDMVAKPTGGDTGTLVVGSATLALAVLVSIVLAATGRHGAIAVAAMESQH